MNGYNRPPPTPILASVHHRKRWSSQTLAATAWTKNPRMRVGGFYLRSAPASSTASLDWRVLKPLPHLLSARSKGSTNPRAPLPPQL